MNRNQWIVVATVTGLILFGAIGWIDRDVLSESLAGAGVIGSLLMLLLRA